VAIGDLAKDAAIVSAADFVNSVRTKALAKHHLKSMKYRPTSICEFKGCGEVIQIASFAIERGHVFQVEATFPRRLSGVGLVI
jgi:hypothetical protein